MVYERLYITHRNDFLYYYKLKYARHLKSLPFFRVKLIFLSKTHLLQLRILSANLTRFSQKPSKHVTFSAYCVRHYVSF